MCVFVCLSMCVSEFVSQLRMCVCALVNNEKLENIRQCKQKSCVCVNV